MAMPEPDMGLLIPMLAQFDRVDGAPDTMVHALMKPLTTKAVDPTMTMSEGIFNPVL